MLFSNSAGSTSTELLDLFTIGRLERPKESDVQWLEFMRSVRWQAAEDDFICQTKFHYFRRFMCRKTVKIRGLPFALTHVGGSNTFLIQYRLICLLLYPLGEHAKCHLGVEYVA